MKKARPEGRIREAYGNPVREYWERIRHKPLFVQMELLKKEIRKAGGSHGEKEAALAALKEKLGGLDPKPINVSQKVHDIYQEVIRIMDDPGSRWEYDPMRANHALMFVEGYCRHSKGEMGGKPFLLEGWQKALVATAFGIVGKEDGLRKYREVFLMVARKNGKSTLAAAIGLYMQLADGEPGAEVYALATKKDQAKVIWLEAKKMVRKSPALSQLDSTLVAELRADFNDSSFRPLGRDSDTLDGLNVHCATMDEIHAWKDDNLYDVIVDGTSARRQPMIFIATTAGTEREHIFDRKYEEATNLVNALHGIEGYRDEELLPVIYELDSREEWEDPECWVKANPGLGTIKKLDALAQKVARAQADSSRLKNLLCKDFDIPETSREAWLTKEDADNAAAFDILVLRPTYGIGGTDLSETTDLTAAKVIFMVPDDANIYQLSMYWMPEELVERRVREDKVPYDIWIERGYVRTCPGHMIDPKYVTQWYCEVRDGMDIYLPWIGYDAWGAKYWVNEMEQEFGKQAMVPVRQGKQTLSSPMKNLKATLQANRLVYNNNPVDKWCFYNTAVDVDKNDNIQPIKTSNPRRRIDGTAATLDAFVVLEEKRNEYLSLI